MRYEHTKIFQAAYILTLDVHKITSVFSKAHKYTLGERLKNNCGDILDIIIATNAAKEKLKLLDKLDSRLQRVRINLRLSCDLKIISPGLLGKLNNQIEEIGKQVGGWRKWASNNLCSPISARVSAN